MQPIRLFRSFVRFDGHNDRWYELYGVLEHALPEFWVLERHN